MPRRSILSAAERAAIYATPDSAEEMTTRYEFTVQDLAVIQSHRGARNRLGFAVQLAYMRFPGVMLAIDEETADPVLEMVAAQLNIAPEVWVDYGARAETRREHLAEMQQLYGYRAFTTDDIRPAVASLDELAWHTDKGIVLGQLLAETLRGQRILLPSPAVLERVCSEAVTRSNRRIYETLTKDLADDHRLRLDELFDRRDGACSPGSHGYDSRQGNRTLVTCSSTPTVLTSYVHFVCPREWSGWSIRTDFSRSHGRALR